MSAGIRSLAVGGTRFNTADDKESFWDKAAAGAWEPETLASVRVLVDQDTLFIDIGGWIGPITLLAAALGAKVLTFEPDPRAFQLISANVAANPALAPRITLHNAAVSPTPGRVRLGSPRKPGDSMGSILAADSGVALWDAAAILPTEIAAMAGDAGRIVLKMDVEGAEYGLLPHLAPLLGPRTVAALIAFHPRLLAKAGHGAGAIEALTASAALALGDYSLRSLDTGEAPISRAVNSTVLLTRR
ncbi:nucleotide-binding protein [Labrys miyagiensis]|uniref:Nucleotide-binding protein n=1 Tax=Labrys miyagiensis TaxID=346912 RepID=A0ABQ6CB30_9HYPH|nr:FkbM family methyltransferase [Labrys miyagiensis]GLS17518.1 nucleotide-binding protein [Labrys miyagiensis]